MAGEYYCESHEERLNELKYRMEKLNNPELGQIKFGLPYDDYASSENNELQDARSDDESDAIRYEESDDETDASQGYHNEEDDGHVNSQSQGNENGVRGSEAHEPKKKGGRGPTHLTRFWEEHDVNNKVNLKFNRFGQPCGFKTCKLMNVIGYFVKGKTISMAYPNWTKVPKASKEKLWGSLKQFFNIDEPYKLWVLKSASKKWKDFKVVLKRKFFKANMSTRRNIANGCEDASNDKKVLQALLKMPQITIEGIFKNASVGIFGGIFVKCLK